MGRARVEAQRGRAEGVGGPRARGARKRASCPPHLRGRRFLESQWRGTQGGQSPPPAHVCLSQSKGSAEGHSWDAPRSRACLCAAAEARERRWGAARLGPWTLRRLEKAVAVLGGAAEKGFWVFGSQAWYHTSCCR